MTMSHQQGLRAAYAYEPRHAAPHGRVRGAVLRAAVYTWHLLTALAVLALLAVLLVVLG